MVNVKKKKRILLFFGILLTISLNFNCTAKREINYKIEASKIAIQPNIVENIEVENSIIQYIAPYKNHIDSDLNTTLCIATETFDKKNGKWETTIGNLLAESTLELGSPVFEKKENKKIDFCLLNHGGIRSLIAKGEVTTRTAFEVMPFENKLIVVAISQKNVIELANYILKEQKPHPMAGILINLKNNLVDSVLINGKTVVENKTYYVATTDYLANGGDNMNFFKNSNEKYDTEYKIRNLLIDYFKKVDTLPVIKTPRVIVL